MSYKTDMSRVIGLGSAKEGVEHWWGQRLSALALIPLTLWFTGSIAFMTGAGYETVAAWVASPIVAGLLILLIVAVFYHAYLGVQVVIEDYVHHEGLKIAGLLAVKAACILLALAGVLSVLILLFRG